MTATQTLQAIKNIFATTAVKSATFDVKPDVPKKATYDVKYDAPTTQAPVTQPPSVNGGQPQQSLEDRIAALEKRVAALESQQAAVKMKLQKHESVFPSIFTVTDSIIKEQEAQAKRLPFNGPKVYSTAFFDEVAKDKKRGDERLKQMSFLAGSLKRKNEDEN